MVDSIQLKKELDINKIHYTITDNSFIVDKNGSNFILELIKRNNNESVLKIYFVEKEPSNRTINLELRIDKFTYHNSMDFLISLLTLPKNGVIPIRNEELRDDLNNLLITTKVTNCEKIEIIGINPEFQEFDEEDLSPEEIKNITNIQVEETPMTKDEILDAMDKALEDGDRESYYKYQKIFNQLKESISFIYLKKFKDFF